MRRNWKRILSLLLTVAMVFTMNTSVFATEPTATATGEDQQTVEAAAEATESTAAETVEETKETNSEGTSETTEAPKTEETATTEEVAAEAAPAETTTATVEETPAVEETAAETTNTAAVAEETTEAVPVEEAVVAETEAVVEETDEVAEAEAPVSAKVNKSAIADKWEIDLTGTGLDEDDWEVFSANGKYGVSFCEVTPANTGIKITPVNKNADELIISSNVAVTVSLNGAENDNVVGTVSLSGNTDANAVITLTAVDGTEAYLLENDGSIGAKLDGNNGKSGSNPEEFMTFKFAQPKATVFKDHVIYLSANSADTLGYENKVQIYDSTVWAIDENLEKDTDKWKDDKTYKVKSDKTSGNMIISANVLDVGVKLYKVTVSTPNSTLVPKVDTENIEATKIPVSIDNAVAGRTYRFAAFKNVHDGQKDMDEIVSYNDVAAKADGKLEATIENLDPSTEYDILVWEKGGFKEDGLLHTDAIPNEYEEASTIFDALSVVDASTFKYSDIKKESAKISVSFDDGESKFKVGYIAVSQNDIKVLGNPSNVAPTSWNAINASKKDVEVTDPDDGGLVPGTTYKIWLKVTTESDITYDGDDDFIDHEVLSEKSGFDGFTTAKDYKLVYDKSSTSAAFRSINNIGTIVGVPKLVIDLGNKKEIDASSDDAIKYAVSKNDAANVATGVTYKILSANTGDRLDKGTTTSTNIIYDKLVSDGEGNFTNFKKAYKAGIAISLNGALALTGDTGNAEGMVELSLTNSKVYVSANSLSINTSSHKLANNQTIDYHFYGPEVAGLDQGKVYKVPSTNAANKAFTATVVGSTVSGNVEFKAGLGTIKVSDWEKLKLWDDYWIDGNDATGIDFQNGAAAEFYVAPSAKDTINFITVTSKSVPYATKANSNDENITFAEKLLSPVFTVGGSTLKLGGKGEGQYTITDVAIVSENEANKWTLKEMNSASFNGANGIQNKKRFNELKAGDTVAVMVLAKLNDKIEVDGKQVDVYKAAKTTVTVTKRDVYLYFNTDNVTYDDDGKVVNDEALVTDDAAVSYNRLRDRTASFPDKTVSPNKFSSYYDGAYAIPTVKDDLIDLTLIGGSYKDAAKAIISDNQVVLLGSALDVTKGGSKPVNFTYTEKAGADSIAKNFNVVKATAYVYVSEEGTYYAQFYAYIDGKQVYSKKMNLTGASGILYDFYNNQSVIEKDADKAELRKLIEDGAGYSGSMNGLASGVDGKEVRLSGWEIIRTDESGAQYDYYIDGNGKEHNYSYSYSNSKYVNYLNIDANNDYIITAILRKYVNGENGVYVNTIKDVQYTGQNHQSDYWSVNNLYTLNENKQKPKYNSASTLYDLGITVGSDNDTLYEGIDYTVKIKNAKNASVKYDPVTGEYTQLNTNAKKMPQAVITGKGEYKGFKATVYFNILPANISGTTVTGLLDSYFYNNKKLSKKASYKVTDTVGWTDKKGNYKTKSLKLKAYNTKKSTGDYQVVIYKAASGNAAWTKTSITDPNKITEKGNYLLTLEGVNNYTGIKPYDLTLTADSAENLEPKVYEVDDPLQFFVETDKSFLLDGATIKLNKGLKIQDDKTYISYNQVISDVVANKKSVSKDGYEAYFSQYNPVTKSYSKLYLDKNGKITTSSGYTNDKNEWVDYDYAVSINEAGKYTVTVYAKEGGQYHGSQTSKPFTVKGIKLSAKDLKNTIYYGTSDDPYDYDDVKNWKPYSDVAKTGISYNGGKYIYVKISGNSSVSNNYQFSTSNGAYNYAAYTTNAAGRPYYVFKPGNYKVTAYGMKQYAGSKVTLSYKVAAIDLKKDTDLVGDLGSKKFIEIGVYKEVSVNAGGTMPLIRISVNGVGSTDGYDTKTIDKIIYAKPHGSGYPFTLMKYDEDDDYYYDSNSGMIFTVNVAKNTKVGTAKVTIKGSGAVKGSITKEFSVIENKLNKDSDELSHGIIWSYDKWSDPDYWDDGELYADVQDEMTTSKEPKYKVDLYQVYYAKYNAKTGAVKKLKKLGSSTREKSTAYFTPKFVQVSSNTGSQNSTVTMSVNFANGTKSEFSFDKNIYAAEKWNTWTDKTPNITSVVVSFNGHKNKDKSYTIPSVPTLDYTGERLNVVTGDDDYYYGTGDIYKRNKNGNIMYINKKGELKEDISDIDDLESGDEALYADNFVVKVGSTTISQNYVITSQTPSPAIKDGTVKFTVKLVKRVPESVEKYTYGGKSKTFTYKIKKASDTAL